MLFVDTSVWSLALRRHTRAQGPEVGVLRQALDGGEQGCDEHANGIERAM